MSSFRQSCVWFGNNRVIAFIVGLVTLGVTWAMAGIALSRTPGGHNLVENWTRSSHGRRLFSAAIVNVIIVGGVLVCLFGLLSQGQPIVLLGMLAYFVSLLAALDVAGAMKSGRDVFELYTAFDTEDNLPVSGRISSLVYTSIKGMPTGPRLILAFAWSWAVAIAMIATVVTMVLLFVFIWLLSFAVTVAVTATSSSNTEPYESRPVRYVKAGEGGLFSETVATIDGDEIREGDGSFGRVLATIRGNTIIIGEGLSTQVAFTIQGNSIKKGDGGFLAPTVATIDGNSIKSGENGLFAETLYTISER